MNWRNMTPGWLVTRSPGSSMMSQDDANRCTSALARYEHGIALMAQLRNTETCSRRREDAQRELDALATRARAIAVELDRGGYTRNGQHKRQTWRQRFRRWMELRLGVRD